MKYDLSINDRFFLNQVIPKWDTGKPFDLYADMKYVFHREKGSNYNTEQFEQTVENIRSFITDHGFAKENPAKKYTFQLLPKGNMLAVTGSLDLFEDHQERERIGGRAIVTEARPRPAYIPRENEDNHSGSTGGGFSRLLTILGILLVFFLLMWVYLNR